MRPLITRALLFFCLAAIAANFYYCWITYGDLNATGGFLAHCLLGILGCAGAVACCALIAMEEPTPPPVKCHYCDNQATQSVIWLLDKRGRPARIKLPWCGCDLMVAIQRFWAHPYQIVEGVDYRIDYDQPLRK